MSRIWLQYLRMRFEPHPGRVAARRLLALLSCNIAADLPPYHPSSLKNHPPTCENFVQSVPEIRGGFGELTTHLFHVLLVALLDFFSEKFL